MKHTGRLFGIGLAVLFSFSSIITYLYIPKLLVIIESLFLFIAWYFGKKYDQIKYRYDKDHLTNTYNRRVLLDDVPKLYKETSNLTVLMIDMDHFKSINDKYGHNVGDMVLQKVAHLLIQNTRNKSDMVIRWGGDEFILLLSFGDENEVNQIIERLENGFKRLSRELKMDIRASIGYTFCSNSTQPIGDFIRTADFNMYQHKRKKKQILL